MSQTITALNPLDFPLHNSRLIEASAGTGKTYTIAALYLRLVLGHDTARCYSPDEILVVTFTEPSTEELRTRIRTNLSTAAAYFRGDIEVSDPYLQQLKTHYAADQLDSQARLLELAAQAMDEAAVNTIHGWCNRMLREHAFASGSLFAQQVNTDTASLWQQVSQDYWRTFVLPLTTEQQPLYRLLIDEFATPDDLYHAVSPLLKQAQPESAVAPGVALQNRLAAEQNLGEQFHQWPWLAWADECEQWLAEVRSKKLLNGNRLRQASVQKWFTQLRDWAAELKQPQAPLAPHFDPDTGWRTLNPEHLQDGILKIPLSEHPFWQTLADLKEAVDNLPSPRSQLLQHSAKWLQQRFGQVQQQRAEMGFDDMLTRLRHALYGDYGEQLATTIRQQFPIAMVDEFQDTDPVQYAIFDKVYQLENCPENTGIFLIGDPKQAIYSFRNADIHTYLQARRATTGRHYTLATNYRSSQAMVDAVNALFLSAQDAPRGAFHFRDQQSGDDPLPFHPVAAHGLKTQFILAGEHQAAMQFDYHSAAKSTNKSLQPLIADWHAEQIVQLLRDKSTGFVKEDKLTPVKPSDIAVLVNSGNEAKIIRAALRKRGVQSVYLSDRDSVFSSTFAVDLLRVLHACAQPRDPSLLRAALASRILGLSLQQIDEVLHDELRWDAFAVSMLEYHGRWQQQGVLAMMQRLLHDYEVPARLLNQVDGERQLTDILHMAELLQQQAAISEGMTGLLRYLAEHIEQARERQRTDSREQQVRLESDSQLVQVITIHKSKGLQYPLVFLPFLSKTKTKNKRIHYPALYHADDGSIHAAFSAGDSAVDEKLEQERLEEDIRKLYVAVTRAQYATFVGLGSYDTFADTALHYVLGGGDAIDLSNWQAPKACALRTVPEQIACTDYQPQQQEQQQFVYCEMPAGHRFQPWWVASYSALKYGQWQASDDAASDNALEQKHDPLPIQGQAPQPQSIHAFPKGAEAGTYLHNLLEDAATEGFGLLADDSDLLEQFVRQRAQLAPWQEFQGVLQAWLQRLLTAALPLPEGALQLSQLKLYQAEPEFWFPANQIAAETLDALVRKYVQPSQDRPALLPMQLNGMLKGFIDLVFEHDGRYYVADYKSNYLGPDASAYTFETMQAKILSSRYDLQYVIYLVALHKLLQVRLGDAYDYDTHVGGSLYLFLRGIEAPSAGVFYDRPPRELIEELAAWFVIAKEQV